jgi:hypothetical protein
MDNYFHATVLYMSFIKAMKDTLGSGKVQMFFIKAMKDTLGSSTVQNVLHQGNEGHFRFRQSSRQ